VAVLRGFQEILGDETFRGWLRLNASSPKDARKLLEKSRSAYCDLIKNTVRKTRQMASNFSEQSIIRIDRLLNFIA
jgi:hypothetical protein